MDSKQSNIDGLQKQLDDFRAQYDLKAKKTDVSNKNENTKATKSDSKTNIDTYTWSADACSNFFGKFKIIIDTKKLGIKVTNLTSKENFTGDIALKNGKHVFGLDTTINGRAGRFSGYVSPSGGSANWVLAAYGNCSGFAKLVLIKE